MNPDDRISAFHAGPQWDFYDSGYVKRTDPDGSVRWFKKSPGLPVKGAVVPGPCEPPTEAQLYPNDPPPKVQVRVVDTLYDLKQNIGPGIIVEKKP